MNIIFYDGNREIFVEMEFDHCVSQFLDPIIICPLFDFYTKCFVQLPLKYRRIHLTKGYRFFRLFTYKKINKGRILNGDLRL